jgi:hypothetical protein
LVPLELTNVTLREVLARVLADNALALEVSEETQVARVVPFRFVPSPGGAPSAVAVLGSFALFDEEFRALYRACDRPHSRLDLDYRRSVGQRQRPINCTGNRMVAQALTLHASAHLALSNAPAALQDATALLRVAQTLRNPPDLTAAMIHVAVNGLYVQVIWEGLARHRCNVDQLRTIEVQLQSLDLLAACFTGWEGEQASVNCWLEQTPQSELGSHLVEEWTGYKLRRKSRPGWAGPVEWAVHWSPRMVGLSFIRVILMLSLQEFLCTLTRQSDTRVVLPNNGLMVASRHSAVERPSAIIEIAGETQPTYMILVNHGSSDRGEPHGIAVPPPTRQAFFVR